MSLGSEGQVATDLTPVSYAAVPGFDGEDLCEVWRTFLTSCEAVVRGSPELRKGLPPSAAQRAAAARALALGLEADAPLIRRFLHDNYDPFMVGAQDAEPAFYTAYYRPEVAASPVRAPGFDEPLYARPPDLVTLDPGQMVEGLHGVSSARRLPGGRLVPYPSRAEIESGPRPPGLHPVAWVADAIEAFMIHVQGSARLLYPDGRAVDLTYAGRNGRPYTSIGRRLIEAGEIAPKDMSLERVKAWVRDQGQASGERGRALLQANESFVFFEAAPANAAALGPIGAEGVPLSPFRSIAIDRCHWPYGLLHGIEAELPWRDAGSEPFARLMVGQDTGSAILGAARADLFFGDGSKAGALAGRIRHHGRMTVLMPRLEPRP